DSYCGDAGVDRTEREAGVEMDVGDDRDRREPHELRKRVDVLGFRHGHAYDLAARGGERGDLRRRLLDVVRLRQRHRLHDDGRSAADLHVADADLPLAGHAPRLPRWPRAFRDEAVTLSVRCLAPGLFVLAAADSADVVR